MILYYIFDFKSVKGLFQYVSMLEALLDSSENSFCQQWITIYIPSSGYQGLPSW